MLGDGIVFLELLSEKHVSSYLSAFSQVVQLFVHASGEQAERAYLQERLIKQANKKTFFYCILDERESCIGAIEIRDKEEYPGQLYCWLNERYWGTGIFQQAMVFAAQDYFKNTHFLFFMAHVDKDNKRSYRALKKCGFTDVGMTNGSRGLQYQLVLRKK